jgi:sphingolipid delta-4 desaturase
LNECGKKEYRKNELFDKIFLEVKNVNVFITSLPPQLLLRPIMCKVPTSPSPRSPSKLNLTEGAPSSNESTLASERSAKISSGSESSFYWSTTDEPHATRRKLITTKYPEIKKLFGHCPYTKYKILASILIQLASVHLLQDASVWTWVFCCYTLSGAINHMMTLAMHELSHNLGAKSPLHNRVLGLVANLPLGIPASASFRRYHMEHHRYQGEDKLDVDIPTATEGLVFTNTPLKFVWCLLQPAFYSLRPMFVNPKEPSRGELVNYATQIAFDLAVYHFYGTRGVLYLVLGTLLGMGVHPVAGHFIAEHYVMSSHQGRAQETYSYYGPLNFLTFNVGYHNEHHDFPFIAGTKLPLVRKIAPEFYDDIPHYHSWSKVIYDYIVDDQIGPFARVKRVTTTVEEKRELKERGGLVK